MKKGFVAVVAVLAMVCLAGCTPTADKSKAQLEQTTQAALPPGEMIMPSTGGASDKVPDPSVDPVAIVSIYHSDDSGNLVQDMDALDTDEMDALLLVQKLVEYGVLPEGTLAQSFYMEGEGEDSLAILDLSALESAEGVSDAMFLAEIGNTFTENFELARFRVTVNGENFSGSEITLGDDDYLTYITDYESIE